MKVRLRKHKINESVAGISDPTLMQQAIAIENQKVKAKDKLNNAKKEYNNKISELDKQMVQILEKQKEIDLRSGEQSKENDEALDNKKNEQTPEPNKNDNLQKEEED